VLDSDTLELIWNVEETVSEPVEASYITEINEAILLTESEPVTDSEMAGE
jgi:hypothetical protein